MPDNATIQTENTEVKLVAPDFGEGRYSALMEECFNDSMTVFKLEQPKAEKLARQIASDLGAIMASAPVGVKLGKPNKDNKITISEAAKIKGVTMTWTLFALKALQYAGEAGKHGFSFGQTQWKPTEKFAKYLSEL